MTQLIQTIRDAWSWTGLDPQEVIATNQFGNLIIKAADGQYWRICPEEWSCERIAVDEEELANRWNDEEFRLDWEMARLVELAEQTCGPLTQGRCYCLKIASVIGGKYEAANIGTISLQELISFSGEMAYQIKDLPDGSQIELKFVNVSEAVR